MALTPSNMLPLGTPAPDFTLPDTISGKLLSLDQLKSNKATVVMFLCNHCPFVVHILDTLIHFSAHYASLGVSFIAISSNDAEKYPADSPEKMAELGKKMDFPFAYLYDETQSVAKAYQAACTPDFYLFDRQLACVYRGQFDASRPGNAIPVTGEDLKNAIDLTLAGEPVFAMQTPSIGCNIKWKSPAI